MVGPRTRLGIAANREIPATAGIQTKLSSAIEVTLMNDLGSLIPTALPFKILLFVSSLQGLAYNTHYPTDDKGNGEVTIMSLDHNNPT
jgi:hypothetical protein